MNSHDVGFFYAGTPIAALTFVNGNRAGSERLPSCTGSRIAQGPRQQDHRNEAGGDDGQRRQRALLKLIKGASANTVVARVSKSKGRRISVAGNSFMQSTKTSSAAETRAGRSSGRRRQPETTSHRSRSPALTSDCSTEICYQVALLSIPAQTVLLRQSE
jgi:hypothetical protein